MKVKDVIKMIKDDGWYEVRQRGSHKKFKHPTKKALVTISFHKLSDEVKRGTLGSILKQAQIKEN
jgi:predicted RNA binding protein YcfA (HicA-like mRNA interferase family)